MPTPAEVYGVESPLFRKTNLVIAIFGALLVAAGIALLQFEQRLKGTGYVVSAREHQLFAPLDAFVGEVYFEDGEMVAEGDNLIQLHAPDLEQRIASAEMDLMRLDGALKVALADLSDWEKRPAEMVWMTAREQDVLASEIESLQQQLVERLSMAAKSGIISPIELKNQQIQLLNTRIRQVDSRFRASAMEAGLPEWNRHLLQTCFDALHDELASARQHLAVLQLQRSALAIEAPFAGIFLALSVHQVGEPVARGQRIGIVSDPLAPQRIEALLAERNVDLLRLGQSVRITSGVFRSLKRGYAHGKVTKIHPAGRLVDGDRFYEVWVDVIASPIRLPHGSSALVEVATGRRSLWEIFLSLRDSGMQTGITDSHTQ